MWLAWWLRHCGVVYKHLSLFGQIYYFRVVVVFFVLCNCNCFITKALWTRTLFAIKMVIMAMVPVHMYMYTQCHGGVLIYFFYKCVLLSLIRRGFVFKNFFEEQTLVRDGCRRTSCRDVGCVWSSGWEGQIVQMVAAEWEIFLTES